MYKKNTLRAIFMRCLIILFIISMHLAVRAGAQQITIKRSEASLATLMKEIKKQSGYNILYDAVALSKVPKRNVIIERATIAQALDQCLAGLPFSYIIDGSSVLITQRPTPLPPVQSEWEIRGTVRDSIGPLAGVSVSIKGTKKGATTDEKGRFILLDVSPKSTLVCTMVGYHSKEILVDSPTPIDIQLTVDDTGLDEVVVVAFGTQKKEEVVGSMTTINPAELKVPSSNLTTALAGRLAGIIAYQRSGEPGQDNADFFIRGVTTFGYKKDPLILIDGVEFTSTDLARLQPDDIASFSIMKDATATALYGARGANGVILVTTKEGKEGAAKVSFRLENSISQPNRNVELADPITYMKLNNEAVRTRDALGVVPYSQSKIDHTIAGTNPYVYPATDWRKELFKDYTVNQRANLNVSGGGKVARYYFAGTFNQDNGVLKVDKQSNFNNNIKLKTYLLRSNINVNLTKTTEVGVRMYGSFDEYSGPLDGGKEMYEKVMRSNPVLFPAYYPKTEKYDYIEHILFGGTDLGTFINPYADMVKGYREYSRSLLMAQFELKQDLSFLTKGLSFRAMGNTNRASYFTVERLYKPFYYQASYYDPKTGDLDLQVLNEREGTEYLDYKEGDKVIKSVFYLESALNYATTIANKHNLSAMLVYIMRQSQDANAGDLQQSLPARNLGLSGRATYSYDNRYSAEFNFGYNGSERFYKNHRFGFFPSGGIAWQVSNEQFWEPLKPYVSMFKVRATYGLVGNDAIGEPTDRFFYLSNVNMDDPNRKATFGSDFDYTNNGVSISRYENNNITWEIAKKTNIGLEMNLFKSFDIQADFFWEYRKNILMTRAFIPAYLGLSAGVKANVGEASGRGVDLSIDYKHSFGSNFWLTGRANFTYATSAYEVYEEPEYLQEYWKYHVGYPISQTQGYIAERLFVDDEEVANSPAQNFDMPVRGGDIKYRDVNGDGQITALDQVPIGNPKTPEIVYGFGFSTGYKNLDLSCFFQGLAQESFWIDPVATAPFLNDQQLLKAYADSHWSEENSNVMALWPRLSTYEHPNNTQTSTWFMRDGTFLRLKTAELGYTFQGKGVQRIGLDRVRVYVSGVNLLTFSRFKLWDVEMAGNGLGYPIQRVYNMGVQVSF